MFLQVHFIDFCCTQATDHFTLDPFSCSSVCNLFPFPVRTWFSDNFNEYLCLR